MANTFSREILADGYRNAVVKISGVLDTADASLAPAVSLTDFVNNDNVMGKLSGLRVDHIWHSMGNGIEMLLTWDATVQQQIAAVAARGRETFIGVGGLKPNMLALGFSGDINLLTTGFNVQGPGPQNFTLLLEMIKLYRQVVQ